MIFACPRQTSVKAGAGSAVGGNLVLRSKAA
jgi:hypothetical protein